MGSDEGMMESKKGLNPQKTGAGREEGGGTVTGRGARSRRGRREGADFTLAGPGAVVRDEASSAGIGLGRAHLTGVTPRPSHRGTAQGLRAHDARELALAHLVVHGGEAGSRTVVWNTRRFQVRGKVEDESTASRAKQKISVRDESDQGGRKSWEKSGLKPTVVKQTLEAKLHRISDQVTGSAAEGRGNVCLFLVC